MPVAVRRAPFRRGSRGLHNDAEPAQRFVAQLKSFESRHSAALRFVNETTLTLEVSWASYTGDEVKYFTVLPHQQAGQSTFVTHPWIVRDKHSGVVLATLIAGRQNAVTRIASSQLRSETGGSPVHLMFENATPASVDVLAVDETGKRTTMNTLRSGESYTQATAAHRVWQVVRQGSNQELQVFITSADAEQTFTVAICSLHSDVSTKIDFVNRIPMEVEVFWYDFNGKAVSYGKLEPGDWQLFSLM